MALTDILAMNGDIRTQAATIKMWLELATVSGEIILKDIPINNVTLRFPLTGVAVGEFILNTGYTADTRKVAQIQNVLNKLESQVRVRCYAKISGRNPDYSKSFTRTWDAAGTFRIWDGLTTGPSFTLNRANRSYALTSRHWITELDSATVASQSFVRNSADNFLVAYGIDTNGGNAVASLQALVNAGKIGSTGHFDMWDDLTKPMLIALMTPSGAGGGILNENGQNWQATVAALQTLCSVKDAPKGPAITLGNETAVKLINSRINDKSQIIKGNLTFHYDQYQRGIREYVARVLAHNMGSAECLEKINAVGSMCNFKLIANVETATLAPHIPVINQEKIWRTIQPSEYSDFKGQGSTPVKLAGVGLLGMNVYKDTNSGVDGKSAAQQGKIVGAFLRSTDGKFLIASPPDWLQYQIPSHHIDWDVRTAIQSGGSAARPQRDVADEQLLGCRVARAYWYEEVYKNRYAELTGRLRFDIGPGSMVKIKLPGSKLPQFNDALLGCVQHVVIRIDANDPQASTTFGISHLRSIEQDDWADVVHPIYSQEAWYGSPLVKLYSDDLKPES